MDGNNLNKVGIKIVVFLGVIFAILIIVNNYRDKNIKRNEVYTIGEVIKIYYGKGRSVDFKYSLYGKTYYTSSMNFTRNINQVGSKYFVIVNKNDLEQAYILDCCPYDAQKHFVPKEGLDKIPDEALQKKADEAFEKKFNSPLGRILPPW